MFDWEDFKEHKKLFGIKGALRGLWFSFSAVQFCEKVLFFAQRVIAYRKILWRDNDFDYCAILSLLEFKMAQMSKHMKEHDITTRSEKCAKELLIASQLAKRINEDDYMHLPLLQLSRKYGEQKFRSEPTDNPKLHRLVLERPKAKEGTPEFEEERKLSLKIYKKADEQRQRDLDYLCKLINKKLFYWWD